MNPLNLLICIGIITFVGLCTAVVVLTVMWLRGLDNEEEPIVRNFDAGTPEFNEFCDGTQWSRDDLERLPPNVKPFRPNQIKGGPAQNFLRLERGIGIAGGTQFSTETPTTEVPASENPGADGRKAVAPGVAGEQP